jgi:hypothetical protein
MHIEEASVEGKVSRGKCFVEGRKVGRGLGFIGLDIA